MADERGQDLMGYAAMEREASRGVVKAALKRAALPPGLPGAHHLYISFRTQAQGVSVPPDLMARYPDEMTIVLQHQFWDLAPGETFFAVTLKFGGDPKKLSVPYAALTRFYDPSVPYLLQFDAAAAAPQAESESEVVSLRPRPTLAPALAPASAEPEEEAASLPADAQPDADDGEPPPDDGPKIVSLDKFRKK